MKQTVLKGGRTDKMSDMDTEAPNGWMHLTKEEFDEILTYQTSIPTGTRKGRQWKMEQDGIFYLGEYGDKIIIKGKPYTDIIWKEITIVEKNGQTEEEKEVRRAN